MVEEEKSAYLPEITKATEESTSNPSSLNEKEKEGLKDEEALNETLKEDLSLPVEAKGFQGDGGVEIVKGEPVIRNG